MRAARVFAWAVLIAFVAWSVWFVAARWWPAQCPLIDGCNEQKVAGHAVLRFGMWVAALAFSVAGVVLTRRTIPASAPRIALTAALAVACFAVVALTLGDIFPPVRPPTYGI